MLKQRNIKLEISSYVQFTIGLLMFCFGLIGWVIEVIEFINQDAEI